MQAKAPTYNLKAVIHETGLTPATLRVWERRYGLLKPQRSPGGHRLYTQREIDMLKWLVARQAEGLSIRQAVEMWKNAAPQHSAPVPVELSAAGNMLDQLRSSWINACLAFDESAAELILSQALAIASPETVCTGLLQKGLAELGERWYRGTVSVQQEHFASALVTRRLHALLAAAPAPTRSQRLLAACPPGEAHDLSLLMLTFILRWHGWEVVYLGADMPLARLDATLQSTAPDLVLSVAQTLPGAAALSELAGLVNAQGIPLAYGGGIFQHIPRLSERISGHYLGDELSAVPQVLESLGGRPQPTTQPLSNDYAQTLADFTSHQALILNTVNQTLPPGEISSRQLEDANLHFTRAVIAALTLGDINFLDYSTNWLKGMMKMYNLPAHLTGLYYRAYHTAVQQHLGKRAAVLPAWFEKMEAA